MAPHCFSEFFDALPSFGHLECVIVCATAIRAERFIDALPRFALLERVRFAP
jgi:hypothetical protein